MTKEPGVLMSDASFACAIVTCVLTLYSGLLASRLVHVPTLTNHSKAKRYGMAALIGSAEEKAMALKVSAIECTRFICDAL